MKRFEKFAHRQFKALMTHLQKYRDDKKSETLHKIRVDIKKIKAIIRVINASESRFKCHKNFIPFRNIFRKAGEIRDSNVNERVLISHEKNKTKTTLENDNVKKLITSFESDIPGFIKLAKRKRNKLGPDIKQVKKKVLTRYLHKKQEEVKSQLFPRPRMRYIHKTRKVVKEVVFLSEVNKKLTGQESKFYNKMEDTIGKLHDKQRLLQLLKKQTNQRGKTQYEMIKAAYLSDKKQIFKLATAFYR